MNRELARKKPAIIVDARPVQASMTTTGKVIVGPLPRGQLAAEMSRLWRAGEIERSYSTAPRGSGWIAVATLRPPRSWGRRNGWKLAAAAAVLALAAWVVSEAVTLLIATAPLLLAALLVLALAGALTGNGIRIVQKVTINR